jgi:hypothetical protein
MPEMQKVLAKSIEPCKNQADMRHPFVYGTAIQLGDFAIMSKQPELAVQYWSVAFTNALKRQDPQGPALAKAYDTCAKQLLGVNRPDLARPYQLLAEKVSKAH